MVYEPTSNRLSTSILSGHDTTNGQVFISYQMRYHHFGKI